MTRSSSARSSSPAACRRSERFHAAEASRDPAYGGAAFAATDPDLSGESGAFRFAGPRPLLLFVLSRDAPRARAFVADFVRRARQERVTLRGADDDVAWSEWAPFEGYRARVAGARREQSGGAADELIVERPSRTAEGLLVPIRCSIRMLRSRADASCTRRSGSIAWM